MTMKMSKNFVYNNNNIISICIINALIICMVCCADDNNDSAVTVVVKNSQIRGKHQTIDGRPVNVFLGIPYAEPPVDRLRFKRPLPLTDPWPSVINAEQWSSPCHQLHMFPENFNNQTFSEDCLHLNIWSPGEQVVPDNDSELKAVMFFIHGGALIVGSSVEKYFNGQVLSTRGDVVVVTVNYRVNTMGFLYTATDDAPGNMGLWDQTVALEWVNDYIRYFGGDPNRITVFGHSAGSWSTSLHILSPISRRLFRNAIMMSGAAINRNAGEDPEAVRDKWLKGAEAIGCGDGSESQEFRKETIDCLMAAPADQLAAIPFLPVLADKQIGWTTQVIIDGQLIPSRPLKMLESGDYKKSINLMVGTTQDEGSWILSLMNVDPVLYDRFQPANITYQVAYDELRKLSARLQSKEPIDTESVAKLYFHGLSDKTTTSDQLRQTIGVAIGDYLLGCPALQYGRLVYENDRQTSRVYQYYYNSKVGLTPKLLCSHWMGVCHFDDIYPVFGVPFWKPEDFLDSERQISAQMIDIFSTFAKTGKPANINGVEWQSYYTLNDNTIETYYEISDKPKPISNFGVGLKINECQYLWKKYIDQQ
ncbi:cholinesterase 1-like [Oppia nitens]|uniref:cholinesterase 1-like n=1 Tax=Oppia nitens TaxID=1686743 RepID=UPI0023D99078|nr:cholinesterase 1-like [Oppia nitens]